jgi:hypothetical protein
LTTENKIQFLNTKKEALGANSLSRMADLIVHLGLLKPWNIADLLIVEHEKSRKSRSSALNPRTALTKLLMLIGKSQAFRIRCIMLILGKFIKVF